MEILEYFVKEFNVIKEAPTFIVLVICVSGIAGYWLGTLRLKIVSDRLESAKDEIAYRDKRIQEIKDNKSLSVEKEEESPTLRDLHNSLARFVVHPELFQIHIPGKTSVHMGPLPGFATANLRAQWKEIIDDLCKQLSKNILYYRFGDSYHLVDLITGEIHRIPTDIPKGLTLMDTGIRTGMIFELREIKRL